MAMKTRGVIELYRAGPEIVPSAEVDARVLAAARASRSPARLRRPMLLTGAVAAAVVAMFVVRIATTPPQDYAGNGKGREEGLTHAWLMDLDLQKPTGPGSQEGLP
jgi:hypothetical protein